MTKSFAVDGQERLSPTIEDALEVAWGEADDGEYEDTVYEFEPMKIHAGDYSQTLVENLMEMVGDEYGDPDGPSVHGTDEQNKIMESAIEMILTDYVPWVHENNGVSYRVSFRIKDGNLDVLSCKKGE